jgi:cytochrome oxidase assembly protein ShyY1
VLRLFLTPRWLGLLCLALLAATAMVFLGRWQWERYELRSEINHRIEVSESAQPVPFKGDTPEWTRVWITGRYDPKLEILVRNRTVEGRPGFEILTPLLLPDGSAVLVDRGWVPPDRSGPAALPPIPPAPDGQITIIGRVRAPESGARAELRDGYWQARRIGVAELGSKLPYKVAPVYVMAADESTDLVPIPASRENDWLNLGYAVQWWLFSGGTLFAFYWLLRREHRQLTAAPEERPELAEIASSRAHLDD